MQDAAKTMRTSAPQLADTELPALLLAGPAPTRMSIELWSDPGPVSVGAAAGESGSEGVCGKETQEEDEGSCDP